MGAIFGRLRRRIRPVGGASTALAALEAEVRELRAEVERLRSVEERLQRLEQAAPASAGGDEQLRSVLAGLRSEIDECRRDNLRIAELYDLTVERLGAPGAA
ncbi:hypothetical protein [Naasia sp. SYSU D00948]|uniref:hypothetical protein n=1 Tax=Naasia sp. SYSU D00948 TaxID=2817379 RepID=UPI001B31509B|nr:hypothetical protein [Naasia sp. SYSU D00948]